MFNNFFIIPSLTSVYSELSVKHNLLPMDAFGLLDKDCVGF